MIEKGIVKIKTSRFGLLEISSDLIIHFPCGIVGLENYKYFFMDGIPWNGCFKWMQSTEEPELAFVITDPLLFYPDYKLNLTVKDKNIIDYREGKKISVYVLVIVGENAKIVTANLFAPIVINKEDRKGAQLVLEGSNYPMEYNLLQGEKGIIDVSIN